VLDLAMPKSTWVDLLERMVRADPGVNVILISDHYSTDSAVEAIQKGACDHLTKPIDVRRPRHRVASFLAEGLLTPAGMVAQSVVSPAASETSSALRSKKEAAGSAALKSIFIL
jgi:DNA-binding NtrC family response regulator